MRLELDEGYFHIAARGARHGIYFARSLRLARGAGVGRRRPQDDVNLPRGRSPLGDTLHCTSTPICKKVAPVFADPAVSRLKNRLSFFAGRHTRAFWVRHLDL